MHYPLEIRESVDELNRLERSTKDLKARDRVRFLRYLKLGQASTQKEAGALLGLGIRQSQRIWQRYREHGINDLIKPAGPKHTGKLTDEQKAELFERLKEDDIASLEQARQWILDHYQVRYTVSGVSALFRRLKIKLKTGRPSHIRKDAKQVEAFKKNSPD